MIKLCYNPNKVYAAAKRRKQTKNHWARDDPGFLVILVLLLLVATLAYAIAFQWTHLTDIAWLFVRVLLASLGGGAILATTFWWCANKYLKVQSAHSVDQSIEWFYSFDIHLNSFFPFFLLVFVVQFYLLPILIKETFLSMLLSNLICAGASIIYFYITFLGYASMSFLERTEVFLYPIVFVCVIVGILIMLRVNCTLLLLRIAMPSST